MGSWDYDGFQVLVVLLALQFYKCTHLFSLYCIVRNLFKAEKYVLPLEQGHVQGLEFEILFFTKPKCEAEMRFHL